MSILKKLNIKREIIEVSIRMLGHTWQDNGSNSIPHAHSTTLIHTLNSIIWEWSRMKNEWNTALMETG